MGCGVVERHLEMAQPTTKNLLRNGASLIPTPGHYEKELG